MSPLALSSASAPFPSTAAPVDARLLWTDFALHPVSLEIPVTWHPLVTQFAPRSARVRWETLTSAPLDLHWIWRPVQDEAGRGDARQDLEAAWKRQAGAAESQAKAQGAALRWDGEVRPAETFLKREAAGLIRSCVWDGRPGCLAVLNLEAPGRRAWVSASFRAPAPGTGAAGWEEAARRALRSLKLAASTDPLRVALAGLAVELPAEFSLEGLRGREGQLYMDCVSPGRRAGFARIGLSELRLAGAGREKVWASLARLLFERGEAQDPVETLIRAGDPAPEMHLPERAAEAQETEVYRHAGGLFWERYRVHVRAGDWCMRKFRRRWAGRAAALTWTCPETHALWALCARDGAGDAEAAARELLRGVRCHGRAEQQGLAWRPFVTLESRRGEEAPVPPAAPASVAGTEPAVPPAGPVEMRRRQLRYRVRARPEVRLETSSKDGTGDLVYAGAPAPSWLATLLRGRAQPEVSYRRLALDPVGRKTWELLAGEPPPSVGELLAELSGAYGLHPVEAFPRVLEFLRMLGERRLVEGIAEE